MWDEVLQGRVVVRVGGKVLQHDSISWLEPVDRDRLSAAVLVDDKVLVLPLEHRVGTRVGPLERPLDGVRAEIDSWAGPQVGRNVHRVTRSVMESRSGRGQSSVLPELLEVVVGVGVMIAGRLDELSRQSEITPVEHLGRGVVETLAPGCAQA